MSPFQALYGRGPPTVLAYINGSTTVPDLDQTLEERQKILNTLKENLKRSRKKKWKIKQIRKDETVPLNQGTSSSFVYNLIDSIQFTIVPLRSCPNATLDLFPSSVASERLHTS
jgi:hypothetical protein